MLSSSTPFPSPRDICLENRPLNVLFRKSFANLFKAKSRGWNTCVMLGGIFVDKMLLSFSTSRNFSVVCPRKASCISKAGCVSSPSLSRSVFTSLYIDHFKDSVSLLQCFKLALKENPFGNWIFGRLWLVLPLYINYIGRNLFSMVIEKVAVMDLLSSIPEIGTFSVPFFCIVFEEIWTYFEGVWSRLIISDGGVWYFST